MKWPFYKKSKKTTYDMIAPDGRKLIAWADEIVMLEAIKKDLEGQVKDLQFFLKTLHVLEIGATEDRFTGELVIKIKMADLGRPDLFADHKKYMRVEHN